MTDKYTDTEEYQRGYADYKNDTEHYIIYRDKIFHITDRSDQTQYDAARAYGISVDIPEYQVNFQKK